MAVPEITAPAPPNTAILSALPTLTQPELTLYGRGQLQTTEMLVQSGFISAQDFARRAFDAAQLLLKDLHKAALSLGTLPDVAVTLDHLTLDISKFDALIAAAPLSPSNNAVFTEMPYTSTYLDHLRTLLDSWVTGQATGLPPAVENAIWERGRAREVLQAGVKSKEAVRKHLRYVSDEC